MSKKKYSVSIGQKIELFRDMVIEADNVQEALKLAAALPKEQWPSHKMSITKGIGMNDYNHPHYVSVYES
jgi:hypothetical protein